MSDELVQNNQMVLISGESGTGKSASLRNIRNKNKWLYENCEAGKQLPFKNDFITKIITEPLDVPDHFDEATENPDFIDGIIIDTITFLMERFESVHVLPSANTQKAWGNYNQFFKTIMQEKVPLFGKPVLILGHTKAEILDDGSRVSAVPVKGALRGAGVEAYFSTVVSAKTMPLKELVKYENDLLNITEEDEILGYKHVFQTRKTKATVGERIRSPMGLFTIEQTFIDNDAQLLLDHMNRYYN